MGKGKRRLYGESMRICSLFMVVAVAMLAGCGMNASNSEAPNAAQAHESSWVTYHRNSLFNFNTTKQIPSIDASGFAVYSSGQAIINENVIQCRVCHGPLLAGPRENYKGSDCLSCHVVDPVKYPVRCYSCHGAPPVMPIQKWMSSSGRKSHLSDPDFMTFVSRVRDSKAMKAPIHLEHEALPKDIRATEADCRKCHGQSGSGSTVDRHHTPENITNLGCLFCHSFTFVIGPDGIPRIDFTPNRNCTSCHADLTR